MKFIHKYGREVNVVNDGGIVKNTNPYIIVVMGSGVYEEDADGVFPRISTMVWEIENQ